MNFAQFQKTLADAVREQAEQDLRIRLQTVTKNNGIRRRAMEISGGHHGVYPSIYMEPYYHRYQTGIPVSQLADLVLEQCGSYRTRHEMPKDFFQHYQDVSDRIYCKLINYEKNQKLLMDVPYLKWLDLALVCYYIVDPNILHDASILIRREHMEHWNIDEHRLLQGAWDLTMDTMKPVFRTLNSVLEEMNEGSAHAKERSPLYLLTNEIRTYGAVLIADPDLQKTIARKMGGDFYILPSSVHECLILEKDESCDEEMLISMIREINRTQVAPQEVLSENLYLYDAARERMLVRDGIHN